MNVHQAQAGSGSEAPRMNSPGHKTMSTLGREKYRHHEPKQRLLSYRKNWDLALGSCYRLKDPLG